MANAVPGKIQLGIAGIDHKTGADFGEVIQQLSLAVRQEWTDKKPAPTAHAGQTVQSAPPSEMMKEGLRLIAAMMAKGDRRTAGLFRDLRQKDLPRQAARLFQPDLLCRRQGRDIDPLAVQRNIQLVTEGTDKIDIIATLRPHGVIKVGGNQSELQGGGNSTEEIKEGHGIAAAGKAHKDPFRRANQPISLELLQKIVDNPGG